MSSDNLASDVTTKQLETLGSFSQVIQKMIQSVRTAEYTANQITDCDTLVRISQPVPSVDLLSWLRLNPNHQRSFWRHRNQSLSIASLGCEKSYTSDSFDDLDSINRQIKEQIQGTQAHVFGGLSFNGQNGAGCWSDFKAIEFSLPLMELQQQHDSCSLHLNLVAKTFEDWEEKKIAAIAALLSLVFPQKIIRSSTETLMLLNRQDSISFDQWQSLIEHTLFEIRSQNIQKVVLAREVLLELSGQIDPINLLSLWQDKTPNSFSFLIERAGKQFLGCSPERLFSRRQSEISTESLAGTMPRGDDAEADFILGQELLNNQKLTHEHALVSQYITDYLTPLVSQINKPEAVTLYKLDRIQHRYLPIKATLKQGLNDQHVIKALHPTPAVGGIPKVDAQNYIAKNEGIDRGWYSGLVGMISEQHAEFAVAIRSALVDNNNIHCYSGVGIVEGSTPLSEWQELESKLGTLLSILGAEETPQ